MGKSFLKFGLFVKPGSSGGGSGTVTVDNITVFGDGSGTQLSAGPGYVDIDLSDAKADELANAVVPGWYKIVNWAVDGVETRLAGVFVDTIENNAGNIRFNPYGVGILYDYTNTYRFVEIQIDVQALGVVSMHLGGEFDLTYTTTTGVGTVDVSIALPWGKSTWKRCSFIDSVITGAKIGTSTVQYVKNSMLDTFNFTGENCDILGLNEGTGRSIDFQGDGQSLVNCFIESGRTIVFNITGGFSFSNRRICNGINTFEVHLTESSITGAVLTIPLNFGIIHLNLNTLYSINAIVPNSGVYIDGDVIYLDANDSAGDFTLAPGTGAVGGVAITNDSSQTIVRGTSDCAMLRYNGISDRWQVISVMNFAT